MCRRFMTGTMLVVYAAKAIEQKQCSKRQKIERCKQSWEQLMSIDRINNG